MSGKKILATKKLNFQKKNSIKIAKDILTKQEILDIIHYKIDCRNTREGKSQAMYGLIHLILSTTGMRPVELCDMGINDYANDTFILRDTKTGDMRLVPCPDAVIPSMNLYLQNLHNNKSKYLFYHGEGLPIYTELISRQFRTRVRALKLKGNKTLYSLRHSFITRLLAEDISIFKIQKIVGHKRITQTAVYTHLVTNDMVEALQRDPLTRDAQDKKSKINHFVENLNKLFADYVGLEEVTQLRKVVKSFDWY